MRTTSFLAPAVMGLWRFSLSACGLWSIVGSVIWVILSFPLRFCQTASYHTVALPAPPPLLRHCRLRLPATLGPQRRGPPRRLWPRCSPLWALCGRGRRLLTMFRGLLGVVLDARWIVFFIFLSANSSDFHAFVEVILNLYPFNTQYFINGVCIFWQSNWLS